MIKLNNNTKFAMMNRHSEINNTHFSVTPLENGNYELWCTHGAWDVEVDENGRAIGDTHFEKGKIMINEIWEINTLLNN